MLFPGYKWASVSQCQISHHLHFMLHTLIARRNASARYCTYVMDTGTRWCIVAWCMLSR